MSNGSLKIKGRVQILIPSIERALSACEILPTCTELNGYLSIAQMSGFT